MHGGSDSQREEYFLTGVRFVPRNEEERMGEKQGGQGRKGKEIRKRRIKVTFSYISAERMGNGDRKKRDLKKSGIFSM